MYFEQLRVGMAVDVAPVVIEKEAVVDFARRYDDLPMHTDEAYAKAGPFGGIIASGMLTYLTVWSRYLAHDLFEGGLLAGKSSKIEWHRPVYPGDTLTGRAEITALTPRSARNGLAELTLHIRNQHGEEVLTAVNEAVVKCLPKTAEDK